MAPTAASPTTFTLRFKNQKSTTIIHADPLQSFESLKVELIRALSETHPDGKINGEAIPSNASSILFARPNDIHKLDKGFTSVTDKAGDIITGNEPTGRQRKPGDSDIKIKNACPKAAGLKDGAIIAYKFMAEDDAEYDPILDNNWDVVMPSYEDQES